MAAKYILSVLSLIFIAAALSRRGGSGNVQAKTWFVVGVIFAAVAAWLWVRV
jgi:hypothetical protein